MKLRSIIIDDEKPSREVLINYITDYCPDVEILAQCDSAKKAYQAILKHKPRIVFLDIEMPNGDGFDLLKMFKTINFKVIFITAFSEYAIRAFRIAATDYLLKPVKVDELIEAVKKARQDISYKTGNENIQTLLENLSALNQSPHRLVISDCNGFRVIRTDSLIFCEADGYCTHFFLAGKEKITSSRNLKHYEDLLSDQGFMRVHNSFLINLNHVKGHIHQGEIQLSDNYHCPLGNTFKNEFIAIFKKMK